MDLDQNVTGYWKKPIAGTYAYDNIFSTTENGINKTGSHILSLAENVSRVENNTFSGYLHIMHSRLEWKIAMILCPYVIVAISCIGIVCNVISLAVLCRLRMRVMPCAFLLISLSVVDEVASVLNLLNTVNVFFLKHAFNSNAWCTLSFVLTTSSEFASVWILVAMTTERFIAVNFPLKMALWHTRRTMAMLVVLIVVMAFLQATPTILTVRLQTTKVCGYSPENHEFWGIWNWVVSALIAYLPIILLTALNFGLFKALKKAAVNKSALSISTSSHVNIASHTKQVTRMCLAVSIVFIFCLLPIACERPIKHFMYDPRNPINVAVFVFLEYLTWCLLALNHSINFFIYCFAGKRFRDELCIMCCRKTLPVNNKIRTMVTKLSATQSTVGTALDTTAVGLRLQTYTRNAEQKT